MSMVKRAFLYLRRKKVRTALLFLLLFVLSLSLAVGVTVWGSVGAVTEEVQDRLGTSFVVKMNPGLTGPFETVRLKSGGTQDVYCGPRADRRLIEEIMGIEGIAAYNAETYQIVYAEDFAPVEPAGGRTGFRVLPAVGTYPHGICQFGYRIVQQFSNRRVFADRWETHPA